MKKIIITLVALSMVLVSCSSPTSPDDYSALTNSTTNETPKTDEKKDETKNELKVTFNSNGGSSVNPQTVAPNGQVTKPANPTKEGYVFDYWYITDESSEYDFTTATINDNTTLHAKWRCVSFELENGKTENDYNYKINYGSRNWNNVPYATPTMTAGSYKLNVSRNGKKIIFEYNKYNDHIDNLKVNSVSVNGNVVTIELVNNN